MSWASSTFGAGKSSARVENSQARAQTTPSDPIIMNGDRQAPAASLLPTIMRITGGVRMAPIAPPL